MNTAEFFEQVLISPARKKRASVSGRFGSVRWSVLGVAALDVVSALIAGLLAFQIRFAATLSEVADTFGRATQAKPLTSFLLLLAYSVYLVLIGYRLGLYRPGRRMSVSTETALTLQAATGAGLLLSGTVFAVRQYLISRIVVACTVALTFAFVAARRSVATRLRQRRYRRGLEVRNILIVGEGRVAHALRNHFEAMRHQGFRFKGFVSAVREEKKDPGPEVIGSLRECVSLAQSLFVDEIYFSMPGDRREVVQIAHEARAAGIQVFVLPDSYDGLAWNAPVGHVGQFPTLQLRSRVPDRSLLPVKRALDVLIASTVLLLSSPLMLLLAVLVRLDSEGPSLYRAERIGRRGRVFRCFKFRTMVVDADRLRSSLDHMNERNDILFKVAHDPRITRLGAVLRRYSLDELPQLLNVLKGDMSLVGPRPPLATEVDRYALSHLRRLDVLPGMTGLWQVYARQDSSFESYISLDTAYIENWSLWLDLRILVRTAGVIVGGTGV